MDEICRACMKHDDKNENFYDFEEDYGVENLLKFIDITSIRVKKLKICKSCYEELLDAFKFRKKCINSNHELKILYKIDDEKSVKRPKDFRCRLCNKVFQRNYNLKRHMLSVHSKSLEQVTENSDNEEMISLDSIQEIPVIDCNNLDDDLNSTDKNLLTNIKIENATDKLFQATDYDKCKIEKIELEDYLIDPTNEIQHTENIENQLNEIELSDEEINNKKCENNAAENQFNEIELSDEEINDKNYENNSSVDSFEIEKPKAHIKRRAMYECKVCHKHYDRKFALVRHSNVHNPDKKYECHYDFCKIRFKCIKNLKRHFLAHDLKQTESKKDNLFYQCQKCPRRFEKLVSLSAHSKVHKKIEVVEWKCQKCNMKYNSRPSLRKHELTHDENKKFKCSICNKLFALKSKFLDHMSRHSGVKPFNCELCEKSFAQSCSLRDHKRTHTQEKPFLCSECGKSFNNGSNLRQHVDRHKGVKRYTCTECPARFFDRGSLKSHMIIHTGEKKHICEVCSSSFTKGHSLRKHMRIHTGEKPFGCTTCPMRFISSNHLKRHIRTHTGEKPYKCTFCERAFSQSNDLVKHLRSHVGDKVYQCKVCPESFRMHTEIKKHLQQHFQETKEGANDTVLNKLKMIGTINTYNGHTFLKTAADIEKTELQLTELK